MDIGAIFIVQNQFGRFLLEQRNHLSKRDSWSWVFPGGAKEQEDKDIFDTVTREAKEEFGIVLNKDQIQQVGKTPYMGGEGNIVICFIKIDQPISMIVSESAGMGWFTVEEIEKLTLGYDQNQRVLPVLRNLVLSQ